MCLGVFGLFWGGWGALLPAVKAQTGATQAELGLALLLIAAGALPAMLAFALALAALARHAPVVPAR